MHLCNNVQVFHDFYIILIYTIIITASLDIRDIRNRLDYQLCISRIWKISIIIEKMVWQYFEWFQV